MANILGLFLDNLDRSLKKNLQDTAIAPTLPQAALKTLLKTAAVATASPAFHGKTLAYSTTAISSSQSNRILSLLTIFGASSPLLMKVVLAALLKYGRSRLMQYSLEGLNYATGLYRIFWRTDSSAQHLKNTQDLQTYNEQTALIQSNYAEVLQVFSLLHAHFNPALQKTNQRLTILSTEAATREGQVQTLISSEQVIDLQVFESSLDVFIDELTQMQSEAGKNLLIYANALPNMQKAEERLKTAQDHLQTAKQDLAVTVQEFNELTPLLQKEGLQQEKTLDRLIEQARLLQKTTE
jgi:hypothetical protein